MNDRTTSGSPPDTDASSKQGARAGAEREDGVTRFSGVRLALRELYYGDDRRAAHFRYGLLAIDIALIVFVVASSFFRHVPAVEMVDLMFGVLILLDFGARMWASRTPFRDLVHPVGIADVIVLVSLLAPVLGENFAFLRVARSLRLLRSYHLVQRLRQDSPFFRRNQDVVLSAVNLFVFILVMTALVYETQLARNPEISNYADALYFTVTTLTTTGFGDITLDGTVGRLLAVLIMIFGVTLFFRLAQTVFRPQKVRYECPECGLNLHDADAVHCKHCGETINIRTEGLT